MHIKTDVKETYHMIYMTFGKIMKILSDRYNTNWQLFKTKGDPKLTHTATSSC